MAKERVFSLDAVRTDGWFERIGDGIGSFQAPVNRWRGLLRILDDHGCPDNGTDGRPTNPDNTLVDFVIAAPGEDDGDADVQRLTLARFSSAARRSASDRRRDPARSRRDTDTEACSSTSASVTSSLRRSMATAFGDWSSRAACGA